MARSSIASFVSVIVAKVGEVKARIGSQIGSICRDEVSFALKYEAVMAVILVMQKVKVPTKTFSFTSSLYSITSPKGFKGAVKSQ